MNANGEIQIRFPAGILTLEDDPIFGFKAFHHSGTFRDGVVVNNKIRMNLHIGEGIGDEFYASLACISCLFKVSFVWKPESTAAMVGERIIKRHTDVSASLQKSMPDVTPAHQLPLDSVREQIMRSYSI